MVVTLLMIAVAMLQQFANLDVFSGVDFGTRRDTARPSAMTGSFLHYPIALSLLSFILLGLHSTTRRRMHLVVACAGFLATIVSYSRSGMVITLVGLAIGVVLAKSLRSAIRVAIVLPVLAVVLALGLPVDTYLERFLSIFRSDGSGNPGRIAAWQRILDTWSSSPLVIGSHAGEYSNISSNLGALGRVGSPESGLLQVLISLGIAGVVAFYGLMLISVFASPSGAPWFRAGLLGGIVQSFAYQSVEVLPFMAIYAITPLIATATITRIDGRVPNDQELGVSVFSVRRRNAERGAT
ncbi:O-antigen ligase family protein [Agromyces larvae]|uniref:O-antigen ligase family protein n=1 Tax=Agromyces larvae TaxID=2929802 RepID=A0ABY4C1I8_9MICO|nr:O-antigen ligase family protein [Agromyces larvae]UOE44312.1 O-antigen ligase family protein [Agromyces larvae]